jgi:hypothetical protein
MAASSSGASGTKIVKIDTFNSVLDIFFCLFIGKLFLTIFYMYFQAGGSKPSII